MTKTNFTKVLKTIRNLGMIAILLLGFFSGLHAQQITCDLNIQVSLDQDCQAVITPDLLLKGGDGIYAGYTVSINGGGNIIDQTFTIPGTVSVSVTNPAGQNECWGTIHIKDYIDPVFSNCDPVVIACDDPLPGAPTATDGCGSVTVLMISETEDEIDCSGTPPYTIYASVITRVFEATDGAGNTATCTQVISKLRPSLANINFPSNLTIDCSEDPTDKSITGEASGAGCSNFIITSTDEIQDICGGSYKVLRFWKAVDWCAAGTTADPNTKTGTQIIKVLDSDGPDITTPSDVTIGTASNSCAANVPLPIIDTSDDLDECSTVNAPVFTFNGSVVSGSVNNVPTGTHAVDYVVEDVCGNPTTGSFNITVVDNTAPIALCKQYTVASIGSVDGIVSVPAASFDNGSYDNCGNVWMKVRRMTIGECDGLNGDDNGNIDGYQEYFDDYATFCCEDDNVTVAFRVFDVDPGLGPISPARFGQGGDLFGHYNECMVNVKIEDKLAPLIFCPADKTIDCTADYTDTNLTGAAVAIDNCGDVTPTYTDYVSINDCGIGNVIRTWRAQDANDIVTTCVQKITIENEDPFTVYDITWPNNITVTNTCDGGLSPDELEVYYPQDARPQLSGSSCGSVIRTKSDLVLSVQEPGCKKILRTWTVIDWCEYNVNDPWTGGRWDYVQVINLMNTNPPTVNCLNSDSYVPNYEPYCGAAYVNLYTDAYDDCTAAADLEYHFSISIPNGTVIKTGNTNNASDAFNNGLYTITWSVSDGCGNTQTCSHDFLVEDKKKPTPVCFDGLSTVVMPSSGAVTLSAAAFDSGESFDNCTDYENLTFSFSSDPTELSRTFTCGNIVNDNTIPVQIWVTDSKGNQNFCSTYIKVNDTSGICGNTNTSAIEPSGKVMTEEELEVEDVVINLDGSAMAPIVTTASGAYNFGSMQPIDGTSYIVRPEKNIQHSNGVTTFDLVLMSKHILGTELLDSPYKIIAADANDSKVVTTFDIVILRRLILELDLELPSNQKSWRFVKTDQTFDMVDLGTPDNPISFEETIDVSVLPAGSSADFIGVKIGDVNQSASPNQLLGTDTRTFAGDLVFQLEDKEVQAGEEFTVDFNAKDFKNTLGYQFTLGFDNNKITFVDIATNLTNLEEGNFGLAMLEEGFITTSWNSHKAVNVADKETIFSLTFTANETTNISDLFNINSRYTLAEAYNGSDLYNVALAFNGEVVSDRFEVYQNTPNPFKEVTTIGFNLPEAATTTLRVFDVSGKVLRVMQLEATKGYNSVEINRAELSSTGVLYYQIETANHSATMKMILVD